MDQNSLDKYLYIRKTPAWLLKIIFGFGIFSWFLVVYGYSRFIAINPLYWWIISPFVLFFTCYFLVSYGINFFYRRLNIETHLSFVDIFWKHKVKHPVIDVFLPICGEETDILRRTFAAVKQIRYKKKKIYVLDDKGVGEHRKLAKAFGFTYFSRKDKGYMKKAGNIKHGHSHSNGEFIVIFDADFAPHPDFIKELLPYMSDQRVAIIQSPQYFEASSVVHNHSKLAYGAANVQEDFYRFIQVARDRLGAPICCGSNAIYRRKALDHIGGTAQIDHSEDMYTGFHLINNGWKVRYLPIILAVGLCPNNLHAYFHQQHRWCSGSMSLMLRKEFWQSRLSYGQKLSFISGFMYYLSYPLTILLSFNSFVILFYFSRYISVLNSLIFIPCILFSFLILSQFRISRPKIGNVLARTAGAYSYCHAIFSAFVKTTVGWEPTNVKKVTISKSYRQAFHFAAFYFLVYISLCGFAIHEGLFQIFNINYYFVLFWIFYTIFSISLMLFQFYSVLDHTRVREVENGILSETSLYMWRFKTLGIYSAISVCLFFISLYGYDKSTSHLLGLLISTYVIDVHI